MRSLVIGGSGQDGVIVSAQLLSGGCKVISVSRRPSRLTGVENEIADIGIEGSLERIVKKHRPDRIYFLAAHHRSSEADEPDPGRDLIANLQINAVAFSELLGSIRKHCPAAKTVYASSCRIFGLGGSGLLSETSPRVPVCAYGISKAAGMDAAKLFRETHSLFVASAILFNHESLLRSPSFLSKKLALAAVRAKSDPSFVITVQSLDAVVDWGCAKDYCRGMTAMLEADSPGDFIIASGELHSVADFARECFKVFGLEWRNHVQTPGRTSHAQLRELCGDASLLKKVTSWQPQKSFSSMIQNLVLSTEMEVNHEQRSSDFRSYL